MSLQSPKNLRYTVIIGATETVLTTDPKGWDEESVARTRTEDFGVNSEITVPLSFTEDGYDLLQQLYLSKGQFAIAYLKIDKLDNDWNYQLFYKYRLDFSKCVDKIYELEIPGIEEGLAVKFEKYKDTEYEIDLPSAVSKKFINYTGASYTDKNTIQCGYGKMSEKSGMGDDYYVIKGTRSVRSYTDKLLFTDNNGLPYETMTFRALESGTYAIDVFMDCTIKANPNVLFSTPSRGNIVLKKHSSSFGAGEYVTGARQINVSSTSVHSSNRIDVFKTIETWNITLTAGDICSFFYRADNDKNYDSVSIEDGSNCRVEFNVLTESAFKNSTLEVFTYEWLISELLKKIDSNATLYANVPYPNIKEVLSATPCITNIGKTNGTGKLKTTLKDVLESYHKLHCTMIDITGNVMTIKPLESAYDTTENNGTLEVANISITHDTKHQYNKIKVGADTDDREDDDPLIYPFICEKEYSIEDSLADAELDLVNPFMMDCYAIDKYIRKIYSGGDNKDECKFMVFASKPIMATEEFSGSSETIEFITNDNNYDVVRNVSVSHFIDDSERKYASKIKISIRGEESVEYGVDGDYYSVVIFANNIMVEHFDGTDVPDNQEYTTTNEIPVDKEIEIVYLQTYNIAANTINRGVRLQLNSSAVYSTPKEIKRTIYKDHTITGTTFKGNAATIYNIPLTPNRILDRWKKYLAISLYGSDNKVIKFQSAKIFNSGITSKCDWETASTTENTDITLTGVDPVFLPALINFDTYNDYDKINDDDKYGYYSLKDKKSGRELQGFINKTTYSVGENQTQQWELQGKAI